MVPENQEELYKANEPMHEIPLSTNFVCVIANVMHSLLTNALPNVSYFEVTNTYISLSLQLSDRCLFSYSIDFANSRIVQ